jgi:hypothetical protein
MDDGRAFVAAGWVLSAAAALKTAEPLAGRVALLDVEVPLVLALASAALFVFAAFRGRRRASLVPATLLAVRPLYWGGTSALWSMGIKGATLGGQLFTPLGAALQALGLGLLLRAIDRAGARVPHGTVNVGYLAVAFAVAGLAGAVLGVSPVALNWAGIAAGSAVLAWAARGEDPGQRDRPGRPKASPSSG